MGGAEQSRVGLRDGLVPQGGAVLARPLGRAPYSARVRPRLPTPPPWASRSVIEDGGVTHERVSVSHPRVRTGRLTAKAALTSPTDVSVSVVDRLSSYRWVRFPPTIQIEGGSYSIAEARRLLRAVEELITRISLSTR